MRLFAGGFQKKGAPLNDEAAPEFVEISRVGTTKSVNNGAISRAGTNAPPGAISRTGTYNAPRPAVSGFKNESYDDSV
jgi:hypothetical protein